MDDEFVTNTSEQDDNIISEAPETEVEEEKPPRRELFEWAQAAAWSIIFIVLTFAVAFRMIGVDGPSMQETLHNGDRIVISKLFYTPKQGDIVVLRKAAFMEEPIVKRVIAVGGQTIDVDYTNGIVAVDGVVLDEPYINNITIRSSNSYDVEFPLTVPENHIFVMGDNRQHSIDSRVSSLGVVDERNIIGKVVFRVYPFGDIGTVK